MHHFSTTTVAKWRWHILWHITLIAINNVVVCVVFPPLAYFLFRPLRLIFVCRTANFLIYAIQRWFSKFYTNFIVQTFLTMHNHSPFGGCVNTISLSLLNSSVRIANTSNRVGLRKTTSLPFSLISQIISVHPPYVST